MESRSGAPLEDGGRRRPGSGLYGLRRRTQQLVRAHGVCEGQASVCLKVNAHLSRTTSTRREELADHRIDSFRMM